MRRTFSFLALFVTLLLQAEDFLNLVETSHHITLKDPQMTLSYTAITGKFPISFYEEEDPAPEIFFIAYFVEADEPRPVTFVFPGGPGGSCAPETLCSFGPRRLLTPQEGKTILPPYRMIDNPETLLPWTDLVFVDPAGCGFSTTGNNESVVSDLFSVEGDIAALGDFTRSFIDHFNLWNSPKYLAGSSYGTVRCCGLAEYLLSHDLNLHGIILSGCALDFSTFINQHNRILPNSLLIPTFAASAWYHGRLWPDKPLHEVVDFAKKFSFDRYIPAILQPGRFSKTEQDTFYQEMAFLVGLPWDTVRRYQGSFDEFLYTTEFFGPDRKVLGGLDTRYVGDLSSIQRTNLSDDPSYRDMQGMFCAFNNYLQNELKTVYPFKKYVEFCSESNRHWSYSTYDSIEWPEFMQRVKRTLIQNPEMQIFIGSGYYDCRTPFAATDYCFDHLNLPSSYRNNLHFEYYEGGHGFIFDHNCLKKLKKDLQNFFEIAQKR